MSQRLSGLGRRLPGIEPGGSGKLRLRLAVLAGARSSGSLPGFTSFRRWLRLAYAVEGSTYVKCPTYHRPTSAGIAHRGYLPLAKKA